MGNIPMRVLDTFPANVHITPNGTAETLDPISISHHHGTSIRGSHFADIARVIATPTTIYIAVDSLTGPVLFFREDYTQHTVDEQKVSRFITVTNKIIAVKKDKSCGCGSRLKNWSPVGNMLGAN
jgi:hypothetical protein